MVDWAFARKNQAEQFVFQKFVISECCKIAKLLYYALFLIQENIVLRKTSNYQKTFLNKVYLGQFSHEIVVYNCFSRLTCNQGPFHKNISNCLTCTSIQENVNQRPRIDQ